MTNVCSICSHSKRLEIDREIVQRHSYMSISRTYAVSKDAISHHSKEHLSRQMMKSNEVREAVESMHILETIDEIIRDTRTIFNRNFEMKRDLTALKAIAEQRQTLDLLCRISMYLHQARAAELQASQQDREVQNAIESQEYAERICDRLNPAELDLYTKIVEKINGEGDEAIIPCYESLSANYSCPIRAGYGYRRSKDEDYSRPTRSRRTK